MDPLLNAIELNDINKVKDFIGNNRRAVRKINISDSFKLVNDTEMLRTLFCMCRQEVKKYYKKCRRTILLDAIEGGKDLKIIETILKLDKGLINRIDASGMTPLLNAVSENREVSVIKLLLEKKADVNVCNPSGESPLHYAQNLEVVQLLIANGAEINCVDNGGCTPVMKAIMNQAHRMIILELIKNGANVQVRYHGEQTCLHLALGYKYDEDIIDLICSKTYDFNVEDKEGLTPLCYAIRDVSETRQPSYRTYFIHKLINKGFTMNSKVFMHAVKYCSNNELITSLLEYVDVRCVDEEGNCVFHHARDAHIVNMLAPRGAPINLKNNLGETPLELSVKHWELYNLENIEPLLFWDSYRDNLEFLFDDYFLLANQISDEMFNLFILYGFSVSSKLEAVKSYLTRLFDYIVQGWASSSMYSLLRHIMLSNKSIEIPDNVKENEFIKIYNCELNKMKGEILIGNISYYDFCIKLYRKIRSPFLEKGFRKSDYKKIKKLFPTFYNEVVVKIRINLRINKRKVLSRKLMDINLGTRGKKESCSNKVEDLSCVLLDCDSTYILGSYMNERDIKCLLAAAIID